MLTEKYLDNLAKKIFETSLEWITLPRDVQERLEVKLAKLAFSGMLNIAKLDDEDEEHETIQ